MHWAKTYLVQADLLEATRWGHFRVTPRGSEVLVRRPDWVGNELLMQFPEFRERSRSRSGNGGLEPISEVLSTIWRLRRHPRNARPRMEGSMGPKAARPCIDANRHTCSAGVGKPALQHLGC